MDGDPEIRFGSGKSGFFENPEFYNMVVYGLLMAPWSQLVTLVMYYVRLVSGSPVQKTDIQFYLYCGIGTK